MLLNTDPSQSKESYQMTTINSSY